MNQHQTTIQHIELHIKKVKTSMDEVVKDRRIHKVIGILSLARELNIISLEEYEHYFIELYR